MKTTILTLFLGVCIISSAQTIDRKKLDKYFDLLSENENFMGSLAIQKGDSIVYTKAVGLRDDEKGLPNTTNTVFRLGSISKVFTSTMIFQLIEEGKLTLDTTLAEYFPLIKNAEKITVGQMLRHQSGLFDFTSDQKYGSYMYTNQSRDALLTHIQMGTPAFNPGEKTSYCNSNFVLLSFIIENLDQSAYSKSLQTRITDKIETKTIKYGEETYPQSNEAFSYMYTGEFWQFAGQTHMSIPVGAGAIVGNVFDVNTFLRTLLSTETLLSEASRNHMLKVVDESYGHGIFKLPYEKSTGYGHGGSIDGFRTRTAYFPESDLVITLLSNGLNYDMQMITDTVIAASMSESFELPFFSEIVLDSTKMARYSGEYTSTALPLTITITTKNEKVVLQATGQQPFTLTTESDSSFSFVGVGLFIEFDELENEQYQKFLLKQGGAEFLFTRKK